MQARETVKHVVLDCRLWNVERQVLRAAVGDKSRWGNLPYLLGGWSGQKDPTGKYIYGVEAALWKPDWEAVKATIDFAEKIGRFSVKDSRDEQASRGQRSRRRGGKYVLGTVLAR